jgi:hypothetical protein
MRLELVLLIALPKRMIRLIRTISAISVVTLMVLHLRFMTVLLGVELRGFSPRILLLSWIM